MIEVTALRTYPVKSLAGVDLADAKLETRGLQYDRRWMIVDHKNKFVTQREYPHMALVSVSIQENGLLLKAPNMPALQVPVEPTQDTFSVTVWKDSCPAFDVGAESSQWLSRVLDPSGERHFKLVQFDESFQRTVDSEYSDNEGAHTGFSDGFPFLLTTQESLDWLNTLLAEKGIAPLNMLRFRPNIVVKGLPALKEHHLRDLSGPDFRLGLRKPCRRCKITTIDPDTGVIDIPTEPLHTLLANPPKPDLKGAFFGQNAVLLQGEGNRIAVGQKLKIDG